MLTKGTCRFEGNMDEALKSHFLRIWCMIVADGEVNQKELAFMYQLGNEYGITTTDVQNAILTGGSITVFSNNPKDKIHYLYDLSRMAWVDGNLHEKEKSLLYDYAILFGFKSEIVSSFVDALLQSAKENMPFEDLIKKLN